MHCGLTLDKLAINGTIVGTRVVDALFAWVSSYLPAAPSPRPADSPRSSGLTRAARTGRRATPHAPWSQPEVAGLWPGRMSPTSSLPWSVTWSVPAEHFWPSLHRDCTVHRHAHEKLS